MFSWGTPMCGLSRRCRYEPRRFQLGSFEVVAQPLEYRFAQQPVVGQRAIFDLDLDLRLDPCGLWLFNRHIERRLFADQRVEPFA